jgi:hypothetical protein
MAPFEGDDVPLSNPSFFAKKMREENALGPPTGSYPRGLIFEGPVSYTRPTEARRDLKNGTDHPEPREHPRGKKVRPRDIPSSRPTPGATDPASNHGTVGVASTLRP